MIPRSNKQSTIGDIVPESVVFLQPTNNLSKLVVTSYGKDLRSVRESVLLIDLPLYPKLPNLWNWNLTSKCFTKIGNSNPSIFWIHFASCIMTLAFTAISPYIYVFRSEKVRKCLGDLLKDHVNCGYSNSRNNELFGSTSLASRISVNNNVHANDKEKVKTSDPDQRLKPVSTPRRALLNGDRIDINETSIWSNKLSKNINAKMNKSTTSQCDITSIKPMKHEKYQFRFVDKDICKLSKTLSCPDVLNIPNVCLESSL